MSPTRWPGRSLPIAAGAALGVALFARAAEPPIWGYSGDTAPPHWASLSPDYKTCSRGQSQSPIDIVDAAAAKLPPLGLSYAWKLEQVVHDGHAIQVKPAPGSWLTVGEQRFELEEFHFHTPSETRIEGKSFPLEAHFTHRAADGSLAIVAVLFAEGAMNASVGKILSTAPWSAYAVNASQLRLSEDQLLPAQRDYFLYKGSLTTPPCTENVRWFVLGSPLQVASSQITAFEQIVGRNARELQPLHARIVLH